MIRCATPGVKRRSGGKRLKDVPIATEAMPIDSTIKSQRANPARLGAASVTTAATRAQNKTVRTNMSSTALGGLGTKYLLGAIDGSIRRDSRAAPRQTPGQQGSDLRRSVPLPPADTARAVPLPLGRAPRRLVAFRTGPLGHARSCVPPRNTTQIRRHT